LYSSSNIFCDIIDSDYYQFHLCDPVGWVDVGVAVNWAAFERGCLHDNFGVDMYWYFAGCIVDIHGVCGIVDVHRVNCVIDGIWKCEL
jgi:hypothetical protein